MQGRLRAFKRALPYNELTKETALTALAAAVRSIIADHRRQFVVEETGVIFAGITETDLARELRDRRWRLPRSWLSEVEGLGFKVRQVGNLGTVRTHFEAPPAINPETGKRYRYDAFQRRALDRYVTIITAP